MSEGEDGQPQQRGFIFPGEFEITAMGDAAAELEVLVPELLEAEGLYVLRDTVTTRPSRQGNYVAVRVRVLFVTRRQYEAAHVALRTHAAVHFTL